MEKIRVAFFAEMLKENFDGAVRTMYQIIERIPSDKFEFLFITGVGPDGEFEHEVFLMPTVTIPINKTYKVVIPHFAKKKMQKKKRRICLALFCLAFYPLNNWLPFIHIFFNFRDRHLKNPYAGIGCFNIILRISQSPNNGNI